MSGPIIKLAPGRVRFKVDNPKGWKWTVVIWMAISAIVDDLRRRRKVLSAKVDDHSIESWTTLWRIHCLLFGPSIFCLKWPPSLGLLSDLYTKYRPIFALKSVYFCREFLTAHLHRHGPSILTNFNLGDDRRYWISKSTWISSWFDFDWSILRTSEPQTSSWSTEVSSFLIGPPMILVILMKVIFSEISFSEEELRLSWLMNYNSFLSLIFITHRSVINVMFKCNSLFKND